MQSPAVQFIQPLNAIQAASPSLRDGGTVYVRVLKDLGGGSFLASFAGNRFEVQSGRPLVPGEAFHATLKVLEGRLLVVPQEAPAPQPADGTLMQTLLAAGLPEGEAPLFLMQFLQQSGMKIDVPLMRRALSVASKFPGRENEAAEAALLLLEKGIEPDASLVSSLLAMLQKDASGFSPGNGSGGTEAEEDVPFLRTLFPGGVRGSGREGLLSFVNHLSPSDRHWIFLPYEWDGAPSADFGGDVSARGTIRLLLDTAHRSVQRMVMDCRTLALRYFFVLYYGGGALSAVRFCTEPPLGNPEKETLRALLSERFGAGTSVSYDNDALLLGICTTAELPVSIAEER